ncbi:MAG: ABC transporter permease [Acholeplasmataceae bacterium]|nr:ABC transporter permease [Acholeplasmataceae bacterium]
MYRIQPLKGESAKKEKKTGLKKVKSIHFLGIPYYFILLVLIIIPLFLIFFYAITTQEEGLFYRITLEHFKVFFTEKSYLKTMWDSIFLAIITTLICLIIGYPTAYIISKQRPKMQTFLILLVTVPMWINLLILTLAWKQIFEMINPKILGTNFAIITGMVNIYLPFMVIPIYTVLTKISPRLYEAATDLGANNFKTFLKVTLPLSLGGVLSGVTMVLLPAATTIVIPSKLGQGRYLIGSLIEDRFFFAGNWSQGAAIAIILAIIIMALIFLTKRLDKTHEVDYDEN